MRSLIVIFLLSICCSAEKHYGFNPLDSISGSVKSIKKYHYKASLKGGTIVPWQIPRLTVVREYRADGKLTFDSTKVQGVYSSAERFFYDNQGNMVKKQTKSPMHPTSFIDDEAYEYDTAGRCVKSAKFDRSGKIDEFITYKYTTDASGRVIRRVASDVNNESSVTMTGIMYDNYNNMISHLEIDEDNDTEKIIVGLRYTEQGLITKETTYDSDGTFDKADSFTYRPDGKISEIIKYSGDILEVDDREKFIYDADGRLIEYLDFSEKGILERKRYNIEYDPHGNWIKMTQLENGRDYELLKREITYYP
jgi:hypothetical protein